LRFSADLAQIYDKICAKSTASRLNENRNNPQPKTTGKRKEERGKRKEIDFNF
jgi:hypothetical protein